MITITTTNNFSSVLAEWETLLPRCQANTIFLTPLWQKIWWEHFGEGYDLQIISIYKNGEPIGIAPLTLQNNILTFVGDTDLFDYHDFIVADGEEDPFYSALTDHISKLEWSKISLKSIRQDSPTLHYLQAFAKTNGYTCKISEEDTAPTTNLSQTWDDYLMGLNKKHRHELRRKLRRLEKAETSQQYICNNLTSIEADMQDFFRLHKASSPDKMEFMTLQRQKFFLDTALNLIPRNQFKLYFLEIDSVRVASCICFNYAGSYLLYNSGYDTNYSHWSVGLLNKALCLRDAIEDGQHTFDFLRGSERYKYELGGKDCFVFELKIEKAN